MATTAHREVAQAVANYDYAGRSDRELSFKKGQRISVFQRQESGWWVGEVEGKRGLFPGSFVQEVPVVEATTSKPGASGSRWSGSFSGSEVSTTASRGNQSSPPSAHRAPPAHATWSKGTRGVPPISTATAVGAASTSSSASVPATSPRTTVSTAYRRRGYTADILACGKVVALFDFTGDNDKKISFKRGDTINVLQKLQEEGWWEGELNGQVGLFPSNYVRLVEMNTTPAPIVNNPPPAAAAHSAASAAKPQVAHAEAGTAAPLMVVCLYDFKTDDTSKLSLKKGDEVELVKKASESWWKGRMGKKIGYFPSSYVKAIEPTVGAVPAAASVASDATGAAQTAVHQPHRAASHGPIPNRAVPPPPSRATRQTLPIEADKASAVTASQTWLVALYHYSARNDDELSFTKGDRMKLVEDLSVNWYRGELHGKVGRVPKNYVHLETSATSTATAAIGLEQVVANNNNHHHHHYGSQVSHGAPPAVVNSFYSQTNDLFLQYNEAEEELERVARAEAERVKAEAEKEQEEQERARALEAVRERAAREAQEKEERERLAKEVRDKAERERVEQEARERAESERIEKEAQEKEERERREREAAEKAERERAEQEAQERSERERIEKEAREKEEQERLAKEARDKAERERVEQEARERAERERQQLTVDGPRAKERERRAREEEEMRLRESEYAAQQEQRRREPPPVASRGGRSANFNRSLPPPPTVAGGSGITHQPRAAPVPTLIPSTIPPLRKVNVDAAGEAAATATHSGGGSSLPPPLVYSRSIAGSPAGGAYAQRASSVPVMTNIPRRAVPATPGTEGHQELRQEVEAIRQAAATTAGDEDESQLATTFEQLRRLVLDERRKRRQLADRLTAVEERLAKLGV